MYEQLSALKINERKRKDRRKPSMTRSSSATRLSDMKSNEEKKTVEKEKRVSPPTMGRKKTFGFASQYLILCRHYLLYLCTNSLLSNAVSEN
jgi:hypothetical protein